RAGSWVLGAEREQRGLAGFCHGEDPAIDEDCASRGEVVPDLVVERFVADERDAEAVAVGDCCTECVSAALPRSGCAVVSAKLADAVGAEHRQELGPIESGSVAITGGGAA